MSEGPASPDAIRRIGLLVVHGIGEQKPGETADRFIRALTTAYGARLHVSRGGDGRVPKLTLEGSSRQVRVYDVHWASLLDEVAEYAFDIEMVNPLAWFPLLNLWRGKLAGPGTLVRTLLWTAVMPLASACLWLVYWVYSWFASPETTTGGTDLFSFLRRLSGKAPLRPGIAPSVADVLASPFSYAPRGFLAPGIPFPSPRPSWLDAKLDAVAGDVFTYVSSAGDAYAPENLRSRIADRILGRFHHALRRACEDGCAEVQILAHSLGTVIAYQGLTGYRQSPALPLSALASVLPSLNAVPQPPGTAAPLLPADQQPLARLTRLFTIGSPLETFRCVWPKLVRGLLSSCLAFDKAGLARRAMWLAPYRAAQTFQWLNFYNPLDAVATKLKDFDAWGPVQNHWVLGGGFLRSHVVYDRNRLFIEKLSESLFNIKALPPRPFGRLVSDWLKDAVAGMKTVPGLIGSALLAAAIGFAAAQPWTRLDGINRAGLLRLVLAFGLMAVSTLLTGWTVTHRGTFLTVLEMFVPLVVLIAIAMCAVLLLFLSNAYMVVGPLIDWMDPTGRIGFVPAVGMFFAVVVLCLILPGFFRARDLHRKWVQ